MTSKVTSLELVTLALYLLGGATSLVDTEDVAMRTSEIAPGRFSWRKYPEQINLELVRVALSDAAKPDNGAFVTGTGRSGWSLTYEGQRWAATNAPELVGRDLTKHRAERSAGSIDERRWQRERVRVLGSDAWQQWNVDDGASSIDKEAAQDLFRIDRYSIGRRRTLKVNRLCELFAAEDDLSRFIEAAASIVLKEE